MKLPIVVDQFNQTHHQDECGKPRTESIHQLPFMQHDPPSSIALPGFPVHLKLAVLRRCQDDIMIRAVTEGKPGKTETGFLGKKRCPVSV